MTTKLTGKSLVHNYHCDLYNDRTLIVDRPVSYAPFQLIIGKSSITFNDYEGTLTYYDNSPTREQTEHKYTAKFSELPTPSYWQRADNSGKVYEMIQYCQYDPKIRETIEVHLQSWDRKEIYIWARVHDKSRWEGYNIYTAIATLDEKSAAILSSMYDAMK